MLALRAEQDDLGVLDRPHAVPGRPVEEVVLLARVDLAVGVRHHELPREHVAPMRRVAGVVLEAFQERRNVSAGAEGEVFASHLAEAGRVAEVACDTCDGAGDIDLGGNLILGYAHDGLLSYWLDEFQSAAAPQRHQRALCSLEHLNQSTSWTRLAAPNAVLTCVLGGAVVAQARTVTPK